MSSRKKVRGYDQQTGQPIYDKNLPSPMESDPLEPLPDLDRASEISLANSLATVDPNFVPAMRDDELSAPEVIANDVAQSPAKEVRRAEPAMKPTGSVFGLGFIDQLNALPKEEARKIYDSLTPVQRRIYDRSFGYDEVTAAKAEQWSDEFFKEQSEKTTRLEDPIKQAQLADRNARVAEKQAVQNDFKIRRQNTIKNIEEILKDPDYASLVGPFDGTVGRAYDSAFSQNMQAKRAKLDRLINIDVLDMTKYLRPISQDELKYLRTLVPGQMQHWEVYRQYLGEKLDMLKSADKAMVNPATNQPLTDESGQGAGQAAPAQGQAAPARPAYQVGKSYRDNQGRVGIFTGYNPDGSPAFSRPGR